MRGLAGDAADGQRVAAVGGDVDLDHVVAQAEQVDRVRADLGVAVRAPGEHQDAVVVVADAELAGGADHAVGDVAVGLARGDREAAGQHRAGQRDDDLVADGEVVRTADDPRGSPCRRCRRRPGTSGSSCRCFCGSANAEHPADDERAVDVGAGRLEGLDLEAERGQPGRERPRR